ncbi:MAG: O-antigen flippase [Acetobacteraceae bacterium]|jgi:O-antigen/teichoic acid export membrane protein|nr:O-antigen flippase [Acetobacteraceae bacterium]
MHAADVLQPLLILPYAGRVLGAHQFGVFAYAMAIGQFAATFVDYGFHWTAQRAVGAARDEPQVIATLFADVLLTKLLLCLLITTLGLITANSVFAISQPMFLCAMLTAFGGIVFPAWLLIGLERGWLAALATVGARICAFVSFVLLVRSPEQVAFAVASQSAVPLVAGLISLPFIGSVGMAGLRSMRLSGITTQLRSGRAGFLYALVERLLMTLPMLLMQYYGGYVAAGQYSVAEKFVNATRPFFRILSETMLSRVAFHARRDPAAGLRLVWLSLSSTVIGLGLSLGLLIVAPMIIVPVFGESFAGSIPIVRLLAIVPLLLNVNACTSNLFMFNYGYERAWSILNMASLAVFIFASFLMLRILSDATAAVSLAVVAREAVVCLVSASFLIAFTVGEMRKSTPANLAFGGIRRSAPAIPAFVRAARRPPVQ